MKNINEIIAFIFSLTNWYTFFFKDIKFLNTKITSLHPVQYCLLALLLYYIKITQISQIFLYTNWLN